MRIFREIAIAILSAVGIFMLLNTALAPPPHDYATAPLAIGLLLAAILIRLTNSQGRDKEDHE